MDPIDRLIKRVQKTQHGFGDIRQAAGEVVAEKSPKESLALARELFASDVPQARMLATFLFGLLAAHSKKSLILLKTRVSKDPDWRVQEILAQAFDRYCADAGYEKSLPVIREWLGDLSANVRRAVTEGLRIWTGRSYFRDHPELAVKLLSALRNDESEYVRRSVGNALRDISRGHKELVRAELQSWDLSEGGVKQTYGLASKFL